MKKILAILLAGHYKMPVPLTSRAGYHQYSGILLSQFKGRE